jgi:hypothetical protein
VQAARPVLRAALAGRRPMSLGTAHFGRDRCGTATTSIWVRGLRRIPDPGTPAGVRLLEAIDFAATGIRAQVARKKEDGGPSVRDS